MHMIYFPKNCIPPSLSQVPWGSLCHKAKENMVRMAYAITLFIHKTGCILALGVKLLICQCVVPLAKNGFHAIFRRKKTLTAHMLFPIFVQRAISQEDQKNAAASFRMYYNLPQISPPAKREPLSEKESSPLSKSYQTDGKTNLLDSSPDEVLIYLFSWLGSGDLCQMSQTSRKIKDLAEDDLLWKHMYEKEFFSLNVPTLLSWKEKFKETSPPRGEQTLTCQVQTPFGNNVMVNYSEKTLVRHFKVLLCDTLEISRTHAYRMAFLANGKVMVDSLVCSNSFKGTVVNLVMKPEQL